MSTIILECLRLKKVKTQMSCRGNVHNLFPVCQTSRVQQLTPHTEATQFDKVSKNIITILETKAKLIEEEKLKAIGKRIQVERQAELRKRKQKELQALVNEKQAELERYTAGTTILAHTNFTYLQIHN